MKDPPHKPLADEHAKYILPVTSCWPPCPFTWPTDQRYRVLWTKGFSAVTCLLTFALNSSYFSALSAYSSSDTLRALTFPLPSRTQPLSSTPAAHTSASAPLLHPGEDSPWSIPPLQKMPAMLPAFLLPTRATKAPSSHSTSYQGAFSSLPTPLHTLSYVCSPTFPLHRPRACAAALLHFFAPQSPHLTRHRRNTSTAAGLQGHPGQPAMHDWHGMGWQRSRGKSCPCALLFGISDVCRRAHTAPWGRTPYFTPAALRKL